MAGSSSQTTTTTTTSKGPVLAVLSNRIFYLNLAAGLVGCLWATKDWKVVPNARLSGAVALVWLGMVLAISFMESWVKFRAKMVTRPIALDVGRTVFFALGRVEIILNLTMGVLLFAGKPLPEILAWENKTLLEQLFLALSLCVAPQVFVLQPILDARARVIASGGQPARSIVHHLYLLFELIKAPLLGYYGYITLLSS